LIRIFAKASRYAALLLMSWAVFGWAQIGVYTTLDEVLQEAFPEVEPEQQTLWLTKETKSQFKDELGFEIHGLRQRYWVGEERTLWILEEIGKEYPITFAYLVEEDRVLFAQVMEYRETRGGEIRHAFLRQQFDGIRLKESKLDRRIDGITGATLSVNAMRKMAKQALWLHREATNQS
jgi:hypothetical protein